MNVYEVDFPKDIKEYDLRVNQVSDACGLFSCVSLTIHTQNNKEIQSIFFDRKKDIDPSEHLDMLKKLVIEEITEKLNHHTSIKKTVTDIDLIETNDDDKQTTSISPSKSTSRKKKSQ